MQFLAAPYAGNGSFALRFWGPPVLAPSVTKATNAVEVRVR